MGFSIKMETRERDIPSPILPSELIETIAIPDKTNDNKYSIETILQAIKDGDHEKTAIILGTNYGFRVHNF